MIKESTQNKTKIGRFGIGFNAVYHWTDLPSFVSANCLVILDPQARFLPNVNPSNPGNYDIPIEFSFLLVVVLTQLFVVFML